MAVSSRRWQRRRLLLLAGLLSVACGTRPRQPNVILWAWERPERIIGVDVGVAVLSASIRISGADVEARPRMQPIVTDARMQIAVVRIDTERPDMSVVGRVGDAIVKADRPQSWGVQIDYDAKESERPFYTALLGDVREKLPKHKALSITALVSWCLHDGWIRDLPVNEAIPMLFRMGPERLPEGEFPVPLCRSSAGVSLDEPAVRVPRVRRLYVFSPRAWNMQRVQQALDLAQRTQ